MLAPDVPVEQFLRCTLFKNLSAMVDDTDVKLGEVRVDGHRIVDKIQDVLACSVVREADYPVRGGQDAEFTAQLHSTAHLVHCDFLFDGLKAFVAGVLHSEEDLVASGPFGQLEHVLVYGIDSAPEGPDHICPVLLQNDPGDVFHPFGGGIEQVVEEKELPDAFCVVALHFGEDVFHTSRTIGAVGLAAECAMEWTST